MVLPWILCAALAGAVVALLIKLRMMQRSMDEICRSVEAQLSTDTNQLITVSTADRHVRRLASELARQLRQLRAQLQKYRDGDRELREAVVNISHDLRTPLTAVCGYLDLLERQELSADTARYVARIRDRADAMTQLTEELFRYSIISSAAELEPQPVDVRRLLQEALLSFEGELQGAGIEPVLETPPAPVICALDIGAAARIFGNIINNAIKYSDGDLTVTLSAEGRIAFVNRASALSTVEAGKLFDRFFTVDPSRRSTGLGLSIARLLTERMGGRISAEYGDGKLGIIVELQMIE